MALYAEAPCYLAEDARPRHRTAALDRDVSMPADIPASARPTGREVPEFPTAIQDALEKFHQIADSFDGNCAPRAIHDVGECARWVDSGAAAAGPAERGPTYLVVTNKQTAKACMKLARAGTARGIEVPYVQFTVLNDLKWDEPDPCAAKSETVANLVIRLVQTIAESRGKLVMLHCRAGLNRSVTVFLVLDLFCCQGNPEVNFDDLSTTLAASASEGFRPQAFRRIGKDVIWQAIFDEVRERWRITAIAAFYVLSRRARMRSKLTELE